MLYLVSEKMLFEASGSSSCKGRVFPARTRMCNQAQGTCYYERYLHIRTHVACPIAGKCPFVWSALAET